MLKLILEADTEGLCEERPAANSVGKGYVYYNTDIAVYNVSNLTSWIDVSTISAQQLLTQLGLITERVVHTTGVSFTPDIDNTDIHSHIDTAVAGTLTINTPIGTPRDLQPLMLRITCTNIQSISWNAVYQSLSLTTLPTETLGSNKTEYLMFRYHQTDNTWQLLAINQEI